MSAMELESAQVEREKKQLISDRTKLHASCIACVSLTIALIAALFSKDGHSGLGKGIGILTSSIDRDIDPYWRLRPTHLHIVMIGDSVTHYQYLSLAYFLRTGRWFDPMRKKSHLTNVYSYENIFHDEIFGEFFFQTTRLLQPRELCDCLYPSDGDAHKDPYRAHQADMIINRYFRDPDRNNTLRFFHAVKPQATKGRLSHLNITDMEGKEQDGLLNGIHQFHPRDIIWKSESWAETLRTHVAQLNPRPEYVVLNGGPPMEATELAELKQSLEDLGCIVQTFWKTTSYRRAAGRIDEEAELNDQHMCEELGGCLDISWTKKLKEKLYWDEIHNKEPVYRVMNEDLLESIGYLPNGYSKFDRKLLLNK